MNFGFLMGINLLENFKMMSLLKELLKLKNRKSNTKGNSKISRKMEKDN